jgi:hypothetical protein
MIIDGVGGDLSNHLLTIARFQVCSRQTIPV